MSRRALRAYVADVVGAIPGATVFPKHPKITPYTDVIIVTQITGSEKRASVPRGGGRKRIDSKVTIVCGCEADTPDDAVNRTDDMVQAVLLKLRKAPLPAAITDPASGEESSVQLIGEDIEYVEDRVQEVGEYPGAEGLVHSMVTLRVSVTEIIQA